MLNRQRTALGSRSFASYLHSTNRKIQIRNAYVKVCFEFSVPAVTAKLWSDLCPVSPTLSELRFS